MGSNHTSRLAADGVFLVCILFVPWWLTLLFALFFSFAFPAYVEVVFAGVAMDLLYNVPRATPGLHNEWLGTEIALLIFIIVPYLRKRITSITL